MREAGTILETERLLLREFRATDVDPLAKVLSDPETMRYYPEPFDRAGVEAWIERNQARYSTDGYGLWGMGLQSSNEMIGDCGLVQQEGEGEKLIEIGYHVRRDLWGKGFATEAARSCRDFGFKSLDVARLISLIRAENLASRRVAEKTGLSVWKETMWHGWPHLVYSIRRDA